MKERDALRSADAASDAEFDVYLVVSAEELEAAAAQPRPSAGRRRVADVALSDRPVRVRRRDLELLGDPDWSTLMQFTVAVHGGLGAEAVAAAAAAAGIAPDDMLLTECAIGVGQRNPNISQKKDSCLHGAPPPRADVVTELHKFVMAMNCTPAAAATERGAPTTTSTAEFLAALDLMAERPALPWDAFRAILLSNATDAALANDLAPARMFCRYSLYLAVARGGLAVAAAAVPAVQRIQESDWELRAFLARACPCGCLSVGRHTSECALPGCGARHLEGGKTLSMCTRCKAAWYCGEAHQRAHWKEHKPACKPPGEAPAGARKG